MMREQFLSSVTVLDTETTHIDVTKAEIIEIASGIYSHPEWQVETQLLGSHQPIPPEASATHHISNHMIRSKLKFAECVPEVMGTLAWNKTWKVAHNAAYDQAVLSKAFKISGHVVQASEAEDKQSWICTYRLAKKILNDHFPDMKYGLSYLRYRLDLAIPDHVPAHRADADVFTCAALLEMLVDFAIEIGQIDDQSPLGDQLHKLCWSAFNITHWPFGKHAGTALADLSTDYYLWALEHMDALKEGHPSYDEDLATSVAQELEKRLSHSD
jgi:exodeoxyribonuclease X